VEVVKIESIGPTAIPVTVINHGSGLLVEIDIDLEVRGTFGESNKLGNDD